jgi:hypothetical protein
VSSRQRDPPRSRATAHIPTYSHLYGIPGLASSFVGTTPPTKAPALPARRPPENH